MAIADVYTLIQTVGLPIAMLVVALVVTLRYFMEGKVVPRWVYDADIAERDSIISRQALEIKEYKVLAFSGTKGLTVSVDALASVTGLVGK